MKYQQFSVLDALRGIAALFVVVRHSAEFFGGNPFFHSFLAVDLFFLLSGFVIAHAYAHKMASQVIDAKHFILVRLIRFYPAYILALVLCAVVVFIKTNQLGFTALTQIALTLLFIPNMVPAIGAAAPLFPLNTVFWSLFYELAVNIFYGITARLPVQKLINIMMFLAAALIVFFAVKDKSIDSGFTWGIGSIGLGGARAFFGIFLGIYLYRIRGRLMFIPSRFAAVGPLLLVSFMLAAPNVQGLGWIWQLAAVFMIFPLCMLWAANAKPTANGEKLFHALGLMSYPAYVLHVPITQLINANYAVLVRANAPFTGCIFLLTFIVLCLLLEKYYERPMRKYLSRLLVRKPTQGGTPINIKTNVNADGAS